MKKMLSDFCRVVFSILIVGSIFGIMVFVPLYLIFLLASLVLG